MTFGENYSAQLFKEVTEHFLELYVVFCDQFLKVYERKLKSTDRWTKALLDLSLWLLRTLRKIEEEDGAVLPS